MTYTRVEAKIRCGGLLCAATTIRRSRSDPTPDTRTPLDLDLPRAEETFTNMCKVFPDATPKLYENSNSATENYLNGSNKVFSQDRSEDALEGQMMDLSKVPIDSFSERFTTIFNNMWHSTHSAQYAPTLAPQFQVRAIQWANYANGVIGDNTSNLVATANVSQNFPGYIAKPIWVSFLLITSTIVQICAIIRLFLKYHCFAPEILGYVSSMTRNNELTPLPAGGSTLDGVERSRIFWNYKVKLINVQPEDEVGRIVLVAIDEQGEERGVKPGRGRLYEWWVQWFSAWKYSFRNDFHSIASKQEDPPPTRILLRGREKKTQLCEWLYPILVLKLQRHRLLLYTIGPTRLLLTNYQVLYTFVYDSGDTYSLKRLSLLLSLAIQPDTRDLNEIPNFLPFL